MSVLYAQVSTASSGVKHNFLPGVPVAQRLGWLQFVYGTYGGKLHPLNFANSIVFPEAAGATGGNMFVPDDVSWSVQTMAEPSNGFSVTTSAGLINLALDLITNLSAGGSCTDELEPPFVQGTLALPYAGAANTMATTPSEGFGVTSAYSLPIFELNCLLAILGFASEIAQQCAFYNAAETYTSYGPYTGSQLVTPTSGVPRSAQIYVASPPTGASYNFGATGALMLGHFCWEYSGFYGPLQYLNGKETYTVPEDPSVTGLYLILKPGVSATVEMGINEFAATALTTSLGTISMIAGLATGYFTPVSP